MAQHHKRYKRFVADMSYKLICQECGGAGDLEDDYIAGYALYVGCGWCEGTGYQTPWMRGDWLRYKKECLGEMT